MTKIDDSTLVLSLKEEIQRLKTKLRLTEADLYRCRDDLRHEKREKKLLQSKQSL